MSDNQFSTNIYSNVNLGNLFEEIHTTARNKRQDIDQMIFELRQLIKTPADALTIVPLIDTYLGKGIDNDSQLVKVASIIQRALAKEMSVTSGNSDNTSFMSNAEWESLMELSSQRENLLLNKSPEEINVPQAVEQSNKST